MNDEPVCFVSLSPSGLARVATSQDAQVLELRWNGLLTADDWTSLLAPVSAGHCGEAVTLIDLSGAVILADLDALAAAMRRPTAEELQQPPPVPCTLVVSAPLVEAARRYCWAQACAWGAVRLAFSDRARALAWARREARRRARGPRPPQPPRRVPVPPAVQSPASRAAPSHPACAECPGQ